MPEPDTPPKSYYHLLGIKPTASAQQIRRAYRDLSKLYHPDTTELPAEIATDKFQQLNEA
ncbi:MAG TPA: J domain-containing protein, partial [Leptolyngbyaceae cyanobacterium]